MWVSRSHRSGGQLRLARLSERGLGGIPVQILPDSRHYRHEYRRLREFRAVHPPAGKKADRARGPADAFLPRETLHGLVHGPPPLDLADDERGVHEPRSMPESHAPAFVDDGA